MLESGRSLNGCWRGCLAYVVICGLECMRGGGGSPNEGAG